MDQLISVASQPLQRLSTRTQGLASERTAVDTLSSLVLGLKSSVNRFRATSSIYTKKTVASSNAEALSAKLATGGKPAAGSYQLTPVQTAAAHQLVSASFSDLSSSLGSGQLNFRFGGHVDKGIALTEINGGAGFTQGKIKITDRNGDSAEIDLRGARTVDDVLSAINSSSGVNITASVDGDSFKLTDNTGGAGNLTVQEVGLGSTAASLGLGGVSAAADQVTGDDIYRLHDRTSLSLLNDATGVRVLNDLEDVDDLQFTLQDGGTAGVDLSGAATLADVIDAINNDVDLAGRVTASLAADGNRLELEDLTTGGGTFTVTDVGDGSAATDLGLTEASAGGVITGRRLIAGLRDTLISSLKGGQGIELADIDITDRQGNTTAGIDLSSAETLGEAVELINASGAAIEARINNARNGIVITDASGGSGNLVVANGASGATADDLGIAVDDAVASVNSGTLSRRVLGESTLLSALGGGAGVDVGDIRITDSTGSVAVLDLNKRDAEAETIGDVIDAINASSADVVARINDAGDGILLTDTGGGQGALKVSDINGSLAADLGIAGTATDRDDNDQQIIAGSSTYSIDLDDLATDVTGVTLASLNNGRGVDDGLIQVFASGDTDDSPQRFVVDLADASTVGDVIDAINTAAADRGVAVAAQLNEAGTAIELVDTSEGAGELRVVDLGSGSTAADLGLAKTAGAADSEGQQSITGTTLVSSAELEQGAIEQLAQRINELDAGVSASVIYDGVGYRLGLNADETGSANELLVDDTDGLFSFQELTRPQDAVVLLGASAASSGVAIASSTNEIVDAVSGVSITVNQASETPVTVSVEDDTSAIVTAVRTFVDSYNAIRTNLDVVTDFDAATNSTGILFGRNEALRVDTTLSAVASGSFSVNGDFTSLESIGVSLGDDGKLTLDAGALADAIEADAAGVNSLLSDETSGLYAKFDAAVEQLASGETSLLASRSESLTATIEANTARLEDMNGSLERQRERLLLQFYRLEETIAAFQSNVSLLENIQYVGPTGATSSGG